MASNRGRQLYRAMDRTGDGPTIGDNDLGVRVGTDVFPDLAGNLRTGAGGMSVAPDDPMNLHRIHRPESLGGSGKKPVWSIVTIALPQELHYRPDPKKPQKHGTIEPSDAMLLVRFEALLASTADSWVVCDV